jgi:hypothetical protein
MQIGDRLPRRHDEVVEAAAIAGAAILMFDRRAGDPTALGRRGPVGDVFSRPVRGFCDPQGRQDLALRAETAAVQQGSPLSGVFRKSRLKLPIRRVPQEI